MRNLPFVLFLIAIAAGGYYTYRQQGPDSRHPKLMSCYTARDCARYIEARFVSPENEDVAARADNKTLIYEYRLDYDLTAFEAGGNVFEDGTTIQDFENNLRANACRELHHRDFLNLGGTVVHHYIYSDGQTQARFAIERCASASNSAAP